MFDLETRTWESLLTIGDKEMNFPSPRRCHGCAQSQGDVYIVGGTDGSEICNDLWKLSLDTLEWTKMEIEMPLPVYFHGTSISPAGQLVIFGGVNSTPHNSRNNSLYSVWLRGPPLKELAWMAFHYYCNRPALARCPPEDLIEMGVPRNFVRRLCDDEGQGTRPARAY